MKYHPVENEKTPMAFVDFVTELHDALIEYENAFTDANAWTKQEHTFTEWMAHFQRYMSW